RRPEPRLEDFDGAEVDTDRPPAGTAPIFDADSILVWNNFVPLSLWVDAAGNRTLPPYLQLQVAEAGWVRAVLLSRDREARVFLERVVQLKPGYAAAAGPYLNASNTESARFAAVMTLLRLPEMVPYLEGGNTAPDLSKGRDSG